jgi:hypothetical protein
MTTQQLLTSAFVVLFAALLLPLSHGARMFIIVALIGLSVLTFIGVAVHYYLGGFGSYQAY